MPTDSSVRNKTSFSSDRWLAPLAFLFSAVAFYFSNIPLMDDPDIPWHLEAGQWIVEHREVPLIDPWSFTSEGKTPWYLLSWLWDVILYAVERIGGLFGVHVFAVTFTGAIVALLAHELVARGIARPAVILTMLLASLSLMEFATARPHISGYLLALAFHAILHRSRKDSHYGRLLWLPPLMMLWGNLHGSFIAGFTVLGAFMLEAWFSKRFDWLKRLIVISIACTLALLINPYGFDILLGAYRTLGGAAAKRTMEWMPFIFNTSIGISSWIVILILASNLRLPNIPIADKILAMAWLLGTLMVVRNGAILTLLSAPYVAACIDEQTRSMRKELPASPLLRFIQQRSLASLWLLTGALYVAFLIGSALLPHGSRLATAEKSVDDAIDYAMQHYPKHRFLTDFNLGGMVIYRSEGTLPMFMDSRAGTAYLEETILDYIDFLTQEKGWEEKLAPYGIEGMIISNALPFAKAYDDGKYHDRWKLVFAGQNANVYIAVP